ncbi:MAG: hypothetical protein ACTTH5_05230 [Wolinella sp.]
MIKKSLAFAGTLYPKTCAEMRLYLDKVARNISGALKEASLARNLLTLPQKSFENIAHEALLGLISLAKNQKIERIFLLSSLEDIFGESSAQESATFSHIFQEQNASKDHNTASLYACEAEVYALLAREIPAVSFAELTGILGAFAPKHFVAAHLPTPKNEIFLPLISYAFKERKIALCELFVSDCMQEVDTLVQRILEDSSNAILLLQKSNHRGEQ